MKLALGVALMLVLSHEALARPRVDAAGNLIRDAHSCGTTRTRAPVTLATPFASPGPRTIYLNRNGGTYNITTGATNAATNTANVIAAGDGRPHANAVIPPLESSFDWPYIVECMRKQYKPYGIIITETEPASGSYIEAVVGGNGASTGWSAGSGILGVAAADNFCGVTEKGIAFSFSTNHRLIARHDDELCATVAHEVGHLLALEHEIAPADTMSYVPFATAGQKSFTMPNSQCGTDAQNTTGCSCPTTGSGQVTSSATRLLQFVGGRPIETQPPTLDVTAPGDNSKLRPSFVVTATAADETAMEQVAVLLDGATLGASTTPAGTTYTIPLANVAEGAHVLEVQAIDLAGNITKRPLAVNIALGATGETCAVNEECRGGICANQGDSAFCTQACGAEAACPADFTCENAGAADVCVPDGGGCSTTGNAGTGGLLFVALAILVRRRRT